MTVLLVSLLLPLTVFGGAAVKFRHLVSIYTDDQGAPLKQPEGVACDNKSSVLVADSGNGRLLRYTFHNGALATEVAEIKEPQIPYPIKVQMNSKGEIYVLDRKQRSIVRFSPEGSFQNFLKPTGLPSPPSYVPRSFTIDRQDNLYILDIFSERVLLLDPAGNYQKQIAFPENYGFFSDVAVDFRGNVLLLDSVGARVFLAASKGGGFSPLTENLREYMRFPASLNMDNRGNIYLVDRNGGSIIILGQDGSFLGRQSALGWKEGRLDYPSQMCINNKGEVFIADTRNSRVQIFTVAE